MNEEIRKEAEELLMAMTFKPVEFLRENNYGHIDLIAKALQLREDKLTQQEAVIKELQKELNNSGDGRGEWHVNHSCVPKQQFRTLEKRIKELEEEVKRLYDLAVLEGEPGHEVWYKDDYKNVCDVNDRLESLLSRCEATLKPFATALTKEQIGTSSSVHIELNTRWLLDSKALLSELKTSRGDKEK